ncbi:MAG: glutamine--tRNA ligase/YqeY domain fusion protein [Zoogloeaceae bacterium]|jgi:glutaminyl-tRNA synthetase|nr:glutamine--tRNA ligase/YqeY domain fusion protein [Zoogloeaceae bacterium]
MKSASAPMPLAANFIRNIVEADLAHDRYASRRWAGKPGLGATHAEAVPDAAKIRTRFPPEPNGYLHFGHAKSICLNFGLAEQFSGRCHMRFDDTNPEKEETEYVESIIGAVRWLGFDWQDDREDNLYYASDYFPQMLACAEYLIAAGHAYVDSQSAEEMRQNRGTLTEPGRDSPWRNRGIAENQALFRRMQAGEFPDGVHVLRAKIDMASPNINLRDPAIYRVRHASHHRTGDRYCVYPMYTFAHPIEDALENVTHSICTLEFEDQRPFYDWLLERLAEGGLFLRPLPRQYEFSRLNLTYVLLSKRKLIQLVEEGHVSGWDDPRMPTLTGARRRGYAPQGFRLMMERIGVSKSDSLIDYGLLEDCMREVMNETDERRVAVLNPLRLVITNYPTGQKETCHAPNHPLKPEFGKRDLLFAREIWIERDDFREAPEKGYNRLYPGGLARLKYAYVVKCTGCENDADGIAMTVFCEYLPDTFSGTPGADSVKVKGNLHWVAVETAHAAEVRLYDRLFTVPAPGAGERDFLEDLNPNSCKHVTAQLEPALKDAEPERRFQFERHGYFAVDPKDSRPGSPVFNRAVTLRDSWGSGGRT